MSENIDNLVYTATFENEAERENARKKIYDIALSQSIFPASIHKFYMLRGKHQYEGFSVPAINVRMMAYNTARAIFKAANDLKVGALIFEIARSEIGYTEQRPSEFTASILAAAIKEQFKGPLFLQGDHYQFKLKKFQEDPQKEIQVIKNLIEESLKAHFYNIDIDASTLVDLSKPTIHEQQKNNYEVTAQLTTFIRELEGKLAKHQTVSVGGEIGEVGGKNSTPEELRAFLDSYNAVLKQSDEHLPGLSKVSVQTGTTHGGVVLPDGALAKVKIDFNTLGVMSKECQSYGLGGAVQHGASTLPEEAFDNFPKVGTLEVHLATEFQNIIYDHLSFPSTLKNKMYQYLRENCQEEKKEGQTEEQFIYKTRKKAIGPFKKECWDLPPGIQDEIRQKLYEKFTTLFQKLNVVNTKEIISKVIS